MRDCELNVMFMSKLAGSVSGAVQFTTLQFPRLPSNPTKRNHHNGHVPLRARAAGIPPRPGTARPARARQRNLKVQLVMHGMSVDSVLCDVFGSKTVYHRFTFFFRFVSATVQLQVLSPIVPFRKALQEAPLPAQAAVQEVPLPAQAI